MGDESRETHTVYKVIFFQQGQVYELYARGVSQGSLFGFVEVEEMVFGQRSQTLIDPSEEELEREFRGVRRTYIPMHAVLRIDQVEKEGVGRISTPKGSGKIATFPSPIYTPGSD